jgi:hypothetical protein
MSLGSMSHDRATALQSSNVGTHRHVCQSGWRRFGSKAAGSAGTALLPRLRSRTLAISGTFPSVSRPPVIRPRGRCTSKLPAMGPPDHARIGWPAGPRPGQRHYRSMALRLVLTGRPTGRRIGGAADRRNRRASGTPKASATATTVLSVGFKAPYSSFWRCLRSIPIASAACCCDHSRAARKRAKFAARFRLVSSKPGREAMSTRSPKGLHQKPHGWGNMKSLEGCRHPSSTVA